MNFLIIQKEFCEFFFEIFIHFYLANDRKQEFIMSKVVFSVYKLVLY